MIFWGFWGVVMIFWGCGVVLVGVGGIGLKKLVILDDFWCARGWAPRARDRPRLQAQARDRPVRTGRRAVERGPSRCAPPRWRASARAAGGWRDPPAETLSTLACAGSTVVVRGW